MTLATLNPDTGTGGTGSGDAHATSVPSGTFNEGTSTGHIGRSGKGTPPEFNVFQRYNTSGIPIGSRLNGANLRIKTANVALGIGSMKVGILNEDAIWEVKGFEYQPSASAPPEYRRSAYFPPPTVTVDYLPHPTKNNSSAVVAGRIAFDAFLANGFSWTAANPGANVEITLGSGIGGEDVTETGLLIWVNIFRNHGGLGYFGITWGSQNPAAGDNNLPVYMSSAASANRPALIVDYDLNPPLVTSAAVTAGVDGTAYTYDVDGTTYTLGDQTNNNFNTDTWTFDGSVPGDMAIVTATGVITWSATGGNYPVTVRLTNPSALFDTQAFTIQVPPVFLSGALLTVAQGDALIPHQVVIQTPAGATFTVTNTPPVGVSVSTSGLLTWTNTVATQPGVHEVHVQADYGAGNVATQIILIELLGSEPVPDANETAIANGALVLLGQPAIDSLTDGSLTARVISDRFAEIRDGLLRVLPWKFAKTRTELAANATPPVSAFARAFPLPTDCIRLLEVDDPDHWGYRVESQEILTSIPSPLQIGYIRQIVSPAEMDPAFRYTLSAALAADLAEVVTGSSGKLRLVQAIFQFRLDAARAANGQEPPPSTIERSVWEWSRGRGS